MARDGREKTKLAMTYTFMIALTVFLVIDAVWLTTFGRGYYVAEIGSLLKASPNLPVAALFYAVFIAGLLHFVIHPALLEDSLRKAIVGGAFFGLVCYATYDLTNLATLKGFTWRIALIDIAWGTFLTATVAASSVAIVRLLQIKL
jgi:uncharacterized membrane protein